MLPAVICFVLAFAGIIYLMHLHIHPKVEEERRRKNNWIEQRNKFFEYMEWFQVDHYTAQEMYDKIETYKELLTTNNELKKHITKRQNA